MKTEKKVVKRKDTIEVTKVFSNAFAPDFDTKLERLLQKRHGKPEPISETLNVLGYEFGDLQKAFTYMRFYPDYAIAYRGEAKAAMADMYAQMELICETMEWDRTELEALGDERFLNSDELDRRHSKK